MKPEGIRAIVVASSLAVRGRLVNYLERQSGFLVVGHSGVGDDADLLVVGARPDLILLDASDRHRAEAFVVRLMSTQPTPVLAVTSRETLASARPSLIEAGVVEVIPEPQMGDTDELVRTARLVYRIPVVTRRAARGDRILTPMTIDPVNGSSGLPGVVAVGASTGGPSAVSEFLKRLPSTLPVPVLIVVHIGQSFGHSLADWLDLGSGIPVHQASEGMRVEAGHAYVCPPDRHLVLIDDRLMLTNGPERHSCRPSVDVLFESVAEQVGSRAIGCLMTGIGRDGAAGLLAMRRRGAFTLAQDEASSAVFGMPREAIAIGAASTVAPPARMAAIVSATANRMVEPGTRVAAVLRP